MQSKAGQGWLRWQGRASLVCFASVAGKSRISRLPLPPNSHLDRDEMGKGKPYSDWVYPQAHSTTVDQGGKAKPIFEFRARHAYHTG